MQREVPVPLLPSRWRWALVGVVAAVIFYASVLVVPPQTPDPGPIGVDKIQHAAGYFVLGVTIAYALVDRGVERRTGLLAVLLLPVLYGAGIEVAQSFTAVRTFDVADMLANAVGGMLACSWFRIAPRLSFVPPERWLSIVRSSE
ncbi:VanZ family protein [Natronoarchaeum mannanilyticum]